MTPPIPQPLPLPKCPYCDAHLDEMNIREVNSEQWMTIMSDCAKCGKLLGLQIVSKVEPRVKTASRIIQQ